MSISDLSTSTLRPGLLVSLHTRIRGGSMVSRTRAEKEDAPDGTTIERWESTRTTLDEDEYERARKCRIAASSRIRRCCVQTSFGMLCPAGSDEEAALESGIVAARKIAEAFNATAKHSQVEIRILRGRIAQTDQEAASAIAGEIGDLLERMQSGIEQMKPDAIRSAASQARKTMGMLDPGKQEIIAGAVKQARKAARAIVKRVEKGGEEAAEVLRTVKRDQLNRARFAFLELSGEAEIELLPVQEDAKPAARELDMDTEEDN